MISHDEFRMQLDRTSKFLLVFSFLMHRTRLGGVEVSKTHPMISSTMIIWCYYPLSIHSRNPFHYVHKAVHWNVNSYSKNLFHTYIFENSFHLWGRFLSKNEALQKPDYEKSVTIHINHCCFTNTTEKIHRVPNQELVYKICSNSEWANLNLSPYLNNVSWITDLFVNFTKPG